MTNNQPAFSTTNIEWQRSDEWVHAASSGGMTLRQYAAIHLRAPDSGEEWLDAMIREARRDQFAGHALSSLVSRHRADVAWADVAPTAYRIADAMLEARKQ